MRTDLDAMFLTVPNRLLHDERITCVKPAGDVGMVDERQKLQIRTTDIISILLVSSSISSFQNHTPWHQNTYGFSHVDIEQCLMLDWWSGHGELGRRIF